MEGNRQVVVSIITVAFNSVKTLEKTLKSVQILKTLTSNIEYIVIDGQSQDGTLNLLNKYREIIDILICEQDDGTYHAMNKGIALARGEWIFFINSDDWIIPENFNKLLQDSNIKNIDIISCPVRISDMDGNEIGDVASRLKINKTNYMGMPAPHQGLFLKRENGFFDLNYKIAADYDLLMKSLKKTKALYFPSFPVATFRMGGVSANKNLLVKENFLIEKKYSNTSRAILNLTYSIISHSIQMILPISIIRLIKKLKKSPFNYVERQFYLKNKK